jgi:hypothetical protein
MVKHSKTDPEPMSVEDFLLEFDSMMWGTSDVDKLFQAALRSFGSERDSVFGTYRMFREMCMMNGLDPAVEKYTVIAWHSRREAIKELVKMLRDNTTATMRIIEAYPKPEQAIILQEALKGLENGKKAYSVDFDMEWLFHTDLESNIADPELDLSTFVYQGQ